MQKITRNIAVVAASLEMLNVSSLPPMDITQVDLHADCVTRDQHWQEVAERYYETIEMRKKYELLEKELKETLISLSGDVSSKSDTFVFRKHERAGAINYKKIPAIKAMNTDELDAYRSPSMSIWKIEKK